MMNTTEPIIGPRAAWRYLRLALYALVAPLARQLPVMPPPMRAYLLLCVALYGYAAVAFLFQIPGIAAGHTGLDVVDAPAGHFLWGLSILVVVLSQIGSLLVKRWSMRRFSAIATATWAMSWWWVTLLISVHVQNYGGIMVWGFITGVHFIFIWSYLVPMRPPAFMSPEEWGLLQRLYGLLQPTTEQEARPAPMAPDAGRGATLRQDSGPSSR